MKTIKLFVFVIISITMVTKSFSQQVKVYGTITDAANGERLTGATVQNLVTKQGSSSNEYGYFILSCEKARMTEILFSFIGYTSQIVKLNINSDTSLSIKLVPGSVLSQVEILGNATTSIKRNETGVLRIPMNQLKSIPMPGAETDILKAYQLMPGVKQGNEGNSSMFVRGGSPEQNLIVIDDIPLYYVNHLGGFVSIFNADAIQSAELYKSGFPSRFGGRLSSVMNVKLREGNSNKHIRKADIGLISGKLLFEGPIKKDTSSYLISVRRFLYDLITRPLSAIIMDGVSAGYYFYDFNLKANYKPGKRDWLYFSIYQGDDKIFVNFKSKSKNDLLKSKSQTAWGNKAMAFKWNHLFGSSVFSRVTTSFTRYAFTGSSKAKAGAPNQLISSDYNFTSAINDFNLRLELEHQISNTFSLNYGGGSTFHWFQPGKTQILTQTDKINNKSTLGNSTIKANESFLYFEGSFENFKHLNSTIGVRFNRYSIKKHNYNMIEPRILVAFNVDNDNSIKASYSRMGQTAHMLSNEGIGMPTDLWMPSTENVSPSTSDQYSLGYYRNILKSTVVLSIEAYYKNMNGLIAYKEGFGQLSLTSSWEEAIESNGKGTAKGIEILAQKVNGRTTGWIGYSLSKASRQFETINGGKEYPFRYDRRHEASVVISHKLNDAIDFSMVWTISTGNAITLAHAKYESGKWRSDPHTPYYDGEDEILYFGTKNGYRMKGFHRLDLGMNFRKEKKKGERVWTFSIYNVYNRQNPYYYFYEQDNQRNLKLKQLTLFPIMPSFSYSFHF